MDTDLIERTLTGQVMNGVDGEWAVDHTLCWSTAHSP
jgi:hypothetical protein